jgi:hypothetical protein
MLRDDISDDDSFADMLLNQLRAGNDKIDAAVSEHIAAVNRVVTTTLDLLVDMDNQDHREWPRTKRLRMEHDRAERNVHTDYTGPTPLFAEKDFEIMFRISRPRFQRYRRRSHCVLH